MKKDQYFALIKELSDKQLLLQLYLTQALLFIISLIAGVLLFESNSSFFQLFNWRDPKIITVGGGLGIGIVILDLFLSKRLPSSYYDDGGLNEKIFQKRSVIQIAFIALVVAFSEELMFRGVIQTHFGLVISSILFALIHYRYLFNWFLFLNITLLSFLIGVIYARTENLLVTIVMHFVIDFLLGMVIREKYRRTGRDIDE
jgi:uncharacterized protein